MEKSIENSRRKDKNDHKQMIYSKQNRVHTDEQGWTTIEANSRRKPKSKNINQSSIDSIIATINVEFNKFLKGAPEAKIDSPARDNRCTIADTVCNTNMKEADFKPDKNVCQSLATTEGKERQGKGTKDQAEATVDREKGYDKKGGRFVKFRGDTRSNKAKENERMETTKRREGIMEWTPTSKEEETKAIGISTTAINGPPEVNQIETSNGDETESSNGNQMDEENNKKKTNSDGDKSSNNNKDGGGGGGKQKVQIVEPKDLGTYASTVSWRPDQKTGKDGKITIKNLMREMAHRTPSIVFHPTNSATSPVPRDINNINNDFPKTPASFDDFSTK
jgi:hypothetical protein